MLSVRRSKSSSQRRKFLFISTGMGFTVLHCLATGEIAVTARMGGACCCTLVCIYVLYIYTYIYIYIHTHKCLPLPEESPPHLSSTGQKLNTSDSSQQRSVVSWLPKLLHASSPACTHSPAQRKGALQRGGSGKLLHPMLGNFVLISQFRAISTLHIQYCLSFFLRGVLDFSF